MIYDSLQINTQIYGGSLFLAFIIFKMFQGSIFIRKENIKILFRNLLFLYLESIVITDALLENQLLYVRHKTTENIVQKHEDINIQKIGSYILLMEFIYYAVHRMLHHRFFYKWIHKKHHENYSVVPSDAFYASLSENNMILFSYYLPCLVFSLSVLEHKLILIFYNTSFYLSHSDIVYDHHSIHHKFHHYNYSLLLPIFDIIFRTSK
jgi:sterol desaturase/sphingolipid hydroxylase (fatty acid hydroxylase superfamily)